MILKAILTGMFDSNCYILGDNGEAAVIDPGADVEDIARTLVEHALKLKYIILTHAHIDHIAEVDNLRSTLGGKTVVHEDDAPLLGDQMLNGSALFGRSRTFSMADTLVRDGDILELGKAKLSIIHTPGHTAGGICVLVTDGAKECGSEAGSSSKGDRSSEAGASSKGDISSEAEASSKGGISSEAGASSKGDISSKCCGSSIDKSGCIFTGDTLFRLSIGRTDLGTGDHQKIIESLRRLMKLDGSLKVYPGHGPATTIEYERLNNPWI